MMKSLTDGKKWLKWLITAVFLIGVFYLLGNSLFVPFWHVLVLLGAIILIDGMFEIMK